MVRNESGGHGSIGSKCPVCKQVSIGVCEIGRHVHADRFAGVNILDGYHALGYRRLICSLADSNSHPDGTVVLHIDLV